MHDFINVCSSAYKIQTTAKTTKTKLNVQPKIINEAKEGRVQLEHAKLTH